MAVHLVATDQVYPELRCSKCSVLNSFSVFGVQVTKMLMISPTGNEVPIGQTLKPDEYIGMTR